MKNHLWRNPGCLISTQLSSRRAIDEEILCRQEEPLMKKSWLFDLYKVVKKNHRAMKEFWLSDLTKVVKKNLWCRNPGYFTFTRLLQDFSLDILIHFFFAIQCWKVPLHLLESSKHVLLLLIERLRVEYFQRDNVSFSFFYAFPYPTLI